MLILLISRYVWKRPTKHNSTLAYDASPRPKDLNMNDSSAIMVQRLSVSSNVHIRTFLTEIGDGKAVGKPVGFGVGGH
jgi:hypothetical protein